MAAALSSCCCSNNFVEPEKRRAPFLLMRLLGWFLWSMTVVMMVKLTMLMMIISNLWAAEVCLPARTLRSVFGLWAFLPAAPQVAPHQRLLQRLQLEVGRRQHEATHCFSSQLSSSSSLLVVLLAVALLGWSSSRRPPPNQ